MNSYEVFLTQCDSYSLKIEFLHIIEDKTARQSFVMVCNIYCTGNAYILTDRTYSTKLKNKAEMRRFVGIAKKAKRKKFKLLRTDNSLGYTRIVYGFE